MKPIDKNMRLLDLSMNVAGKVIFLHAHEVASFLPTEMTFYTRFATFIAYIYEH